MKKNLIIALETTTVLTVPFSVFAATSNNLLTKDIRSFAKLNFTKLNDKQKSDESTYSKKMADVQKENMNKMVANGAMTKDQGDAALKKIEEMLQKDNGKCLLPGFGMEGGSDSREMGRESTL